MSSTPLIRNQADSDPEVAIVMPRSVARRLGKAVMQDITWSETSEEELFHELYTALGEPE